MHQLDIGRASAAFIPDESLVVVVEMSTSSWLVSGLLPYVDRRPLKKMAPNEDGLFRLIKGWRHDAEAAGAWIARTVVAYEAGRDGFWLARWLAARGIEARVIHPSSVAGHARAPKGQNRSARYNAPHTGHARLAARRAGTLHDGVNPAH